MASLFPRQATNQNRAQNYARRISSHLAGALFVFALFQIFVVAKLGGSLAMHFGIIAAVAGFAGMEHRWVRLSTSGLLASEYTIRFRTDLLQVWGATLIAPLLWIPVGMIGRFVFG